MTDDQGRQNAVEVALRRALDELAQLRLQVAQLSQNQRSSGGGQSGPGGGSYSYYVAVGAIAGGTDPTAGGSPGTADLAVYQVQDGAYTRVGGDSKTYTVNNCYPDATTSGHLLTLTQSSANEYAVHSEACSTF